MAHNLFGPNGLKKGNDKKDDAPDLDELQGLMGGNPPPPKEQPPATEPEIVPEAPTQPPVDKPAEPPRKPKAPANKSKKKQKDEDEPDEKDMVDKVKFSIYLPTELSRSMRIAYAITGKKYSHQAEDALTEMLQRRYQCNKAKCNVRFSISAEDKAPSYCPCCGGKDISIVRYEF